MVDISDHQLVPEHRVLEESELEEVLTEYSIDRTELPKIRASDSALPAAASAGDVVEITRDSRTTDTATVYRLVIE